MRKISLLSAGIIFFCGWSYAGEVQPQGEFAELHACELYTGGCTASAQATQGGRSLLRVWHFESGRVDNVDLSGLSVAVLEVAEENLAMPGTTPKAAIAYLPEQTGEAERGALLGWLKECGVAVTDSRIAAVKYARDGSLISFQACKDIEFSTRAIEACDAGACGEQLWYVPRGKTGAYTVLVNDRSRVEEPAFKLAWRDHSSKSVFFGRFGVPDQPAFTQSGFH